MVALEVITAKEKGRYESARKLNPQVPDRLDLMIAKMMEKDADRRCKDCEEVIQMLASLGLENSSLSFIDAPGRVVQSASSGSSAASRTNQRPAASAPRPAASGMPKSSATDADEQARRSPANAAIATNMWIVQFKSPQGKETIAKLTTVQIQTAIKSGTLDNKARLKKNAADTFMPVGFFPEFEKAVEGRNIKEKAELKTVGLKAEFAKIGRQYDRRAWMRWLGGMASGTAGLVKLVIWLAMVFGGIGALFFFRSEVWNLIGIGWDAFANFYNSFQKG